jgi:hypothetical protein
MAPGPETEKKRALTQTQSRSPASGKIPDKIQQRAAAPWQETSEQKNGPAKTNRQEKQQSGSTEQLVRLARPASREKKGRGLSGSMDERFGSCEICAHTEQDSKREKQLIQGNKKRQKSFTGRGLVAD